MKIKSNYVLQTIADEYIVVPIAEEANRLHGIIRLNETGAFIWNYLSERARTIEEIQNALMAKYGINESQAHSDTNSFIKTISGIGCIE